MRSAKNNSSRQLVVYGDSCSVANCLTKKLGDISRDFWNFGQ